MGSIIKTRVLHIGGMTCVSCQNKIEKKLQNTAGILNAEVSYNAGTANVTYDTDIISYKSIVGIIENLDYKVLIDPNKKGINAAPDNRNFTYHCSALHGNRTNWTIKPSLTRTACRSDHELWNVICHRSCDIGSLCGDVWRDKLIPVYSKNNLGEYW